MNNNAPKKAKSYRAILASAKVLMNKHGVSRVTVEELCNEAGVSKMTFYRNFENKNEVATRLLEEAIQNGLVAYRTLMKSNLPYPEKIRGMVELKREGLHEIGEEFLKDIFQNGNEDLKTFLHQASQENRAEYREDLKKAQAEGWLRPDIKIDLMMALLDTLYEMMENTALRSLYATEEELIMELTNFYFYGFLTQPNH